LTTAAKQRAVHAALAVFTFWPACQLALSLQFGVSSWKLGGFGMYATPQRQPGLVARGFTAEGLAHPLRQPYPDALRNELARFQRWRSALGGLHPPERLARAILDAHPEFARVELELSELRLDRATAVLVDDRSRHSYAREQPRSSR
jgi:hypothetical protein